MATNSADRPHSAGLVMIQMWILLYEINLLIKRFSLTRRTGSTINLSANYSPVHELRCNLQNTIKWFNIKQLFVVGQKTNSRALLPISIEDEVNNCFSIILYSDDHHQGEKKSPHQIFLSIQCKVSAFNREVTSSKLS